MECVWNVNIFNSTLPKTYIFNGERKILFDIGRCKLVNLLVCCVKLFQMEMCQLLCRSPMFINISVTCHNYKNGNSIISIISSCYYSEKKNTSQSCIHYLLQNINSFAQCGLLNVLAAFKLVVKLSYVYFYLIVIYFILFYYEW